MPLISLCEETELQPDSEEIPKHCSFLSKGFPLTLWNDSQDEAAKGLCLWTAAIFIRFLKAALDLMYF